MSREFFFLLWHVSCHSWAANVGLQGALTLCSTQCKTEKPLGNQPQAGHRRPVALPCDHHSSDATDKYLESSLELQSLLAITELDLQNQPVRCHLVYR